MQSEGGGSAQLGPWTNWWIEPMWKGGTRDVLATGEAMESV